MRKIILLALSIFTLLTTLSCGRDSRNWPHLCDDLEKQNIVKIEFDFFKKEQSNIKNYEKKICTEQELIKYNMTMISAFSYEKKIMTEVYNDSWILYSDINIYFYDKTNFEIKYYCYGLTNWLVSFVQNEYHILSGDFSGIYDYFLVDGNEIPK